jgi:hypothetical protein
MMKEILKILPVVLYFFVGLICSVMAFKCLRAKKFLPFHEKAVGKQWKEIDNSFKLVFLSLLRLAGLGFLTISILLIVFPTVNFVYPNTFYKYSIPGIALVYCAGLFLINYRLREKTGVDTPWKESLYAMVVLIAGIIVSLFARTSF